MTALQLTTVSNSPTIDPDYESFLGDYLDRCRFVPGPHGRVSAEIRTDEGLLYLSIRADGCEFLPVPPENVPDDKGILPDPTHSDRETFLQTIAPALEEPLVVQVVGHQNTRFPVIAYQYRVSPDGTVLSDEFSWDDGAFEDVAQTETTNAEQPTG